MRVPERKIAEVVAEAASQLQDPKYISSQVDELAAAQPAVMQYVVAHKGELSVEAIVQVLFQAALLRRSIKAARGRMPGRINYAQLDSAATRTPTLEALAEDEPDLASFILSNLDQEANRAETELSGKLLAHIAKALVEA